MKRITILAAWLLLVAVVAPAGAQKEFPAPPLSPDNFHLEEFQGQVVLLDFWASWCKPCRKSLPWLAEMQARYAEQGLVVVTVNLDQDPADAAEMAATLPAGIVQVHDPEGQLASQYQLEGMPTAILFDRQGKQTACHLGFQTKEAPDRETELRTLLAKGAGHEG